jgi:class 3 adenylate cyclase
MCPQGEIVPTIENLLQDLNRIEREIRGSESHVHLLLVDLASSTEFKTKHPEFVWLKRLKTFYTIVQTAATPLEPNKWLGDGVLFQAPAEKMTADEFFNVARRIRAAIQEANKIESFKGEHTIHCRQIVHTGNVFFFNGNDPQGATVDKLFRLEKYVPDDYLGASAEFASSMTQSTLRQIGIFDLKGLSSSGHELFLDIPVGQLEPPEISEKLVSQISERMWRGYTHANEATYLVGGYIPHTEWPVASVQMGDVDGLFGAYQRLAESIGQKAIQIVRSIDFRDDLYKYNVLSIGGPCYNGVTRQLLEQAKLPFEFVDIDSTDEETPIRDIRTGDIFTRRFGSTKHLEEDWGLFARIPNPFSPTRHAIIICGIESSAVDGMVRLFSARTNPAFKTLLAAIGALDQQPDSKSETPNFCAIARFRVDAHGRAALPVINEHNFRIYLIN